MKLAVSIPLGLPGKTQSSGKIWNEFLSASSDVKIATGYITEDAVIEIKKISEVNSQPNFEIFIGMHYFDLFTRTQYQAVNELNAFLVSNNRGHIYLSPKTKFHGKIYSFSHNGHCIAAAVGSSNLGSFVGTSSDLYEIDCCFQDNEECSRIDQSITDIINELGAPFDTITIEKFNDRNKILEGEYGVKNVEDKIPNLLSKKTSEFFDFPLKTEAKSNLNVFFGKGRVTKSGFEQPRPWYEVEIIVPREVTSKPNYPAGENIMVCTEDGWMFECSINGDYGKNFRSANDLKILGKWLKGKMEAEGALVIGQPITDETLKIFGKKNLRLTKTTDNGIWILEMI